MKLDPSTGKNRAMFERLHIDLPLLLGILLLMGFGLVVMYSASGQSLAMMDRQAMRMVLATVVMLVLAQLSPRTYEALAPLMFVTGVALLFGVLFFGEASKGAQRWLNLGFVRFQPSETTQACRPFNGGALHWTSSSPADVQNTVHRHGDGVCTDNFNRQTARPRHIHPYCGIRHFCYLSCWHQLAHYRSRRGRTGRIHPRVMVFLDARIPENPRTHTV